MKKLLIIISLLFVTVCYAAPPPDSVADLQSVQFYETEMATMDVPVFVQGIEAQEVAFVYLGSYLFEAGPATFICATELRKTAQWPAVNDLYNNVFRLYQMNYCNQTTNRKYLLTRLRNFQHTNYGYPSTGNEAGRVA